MGFWAGKRVAVTGGGGFVGSHVIELLLKQQAQVTAVDDFHPQKQDRLAGIRDSITCLDLDLRSFEKSVKAVKNQEIVLHLAARVQGIRFNNAHQATMLRDNLLLGANVLEASRQAGVERFLMVSSACVYPEEALIPTPESEGFRGLPAPTNLGYGWAKRTAELMSQTYAEEFGMQIAIARPFNTYGPRDHFESPDAHVIAALMRRLLDGENPLKVWGSGQQTRTFLYVTDLARGLLDLTERYPGPDPVNLGTDEEITIRDLAQLILRHWGKNVQLQFTSDQPAGQMRRTCDTSKARRLIGFKAEVSLDEGVAKTLEWLKQHQALLQNAAR